MAIKITTQQMNEEMTEIMANNQIAINKHLAAEKDPNMSAEEKSKIEKEFKKTLEENTRRMNAVMYLWETNPDK
jgi:hypothetical protein